MKTLFEALRDLVLLRRGPQDLPYSPTVFAAVFALSIVIDVAVEYRFPLREATAATPAIPLSAYFAAASLSALITVLLPYVALRLRRLDARFVQTATALLGTGLVLELLALPGRILIGVIPEDAEKITGAQALGSLLVLVVLGWMVVVSGHILRHALDQKFAVGVVLAIAFLVIHVRILNALFATGSGG